MSANHRRAAARRRAWGRGPAILRFEPLEGRQLLATGPGNGPDLVAVAFTTPHNLDWGDPVRVTGTIKNQGDVAVPSAFRVDVYAAVDQVPDAGSPRIGTIELPGGLAPGVSTTFDRTFDLPPAAIPDLDEAPSYYLTLVVDAEERVVETDEANNLGQGQGEDTSVVVVTPRETAILAGHGFLLTPETTGWGGTISVTTRVRNNGRGAAPPTRARILLTPFGEAPGGPNDVTIGNLSVPAIGASQAVDVTGEITLPAAPPPTLAGGTKFLISVALDADHVTSLAPRQADQGFGLDGAVLTVAPGPAPAAPAALPNLSLAAIQGPAQLPSWGESFPVSATVQNTGAVDAGPFQVRFLLVDDAHPNASPLALADASITGLKSGFAQDIVQSVDLTGKLPEHLDPGQAIASRIVVQVDPENLLDEASATDNLLRSAPLTLRLIGSDGRATPLPLNGPVVRPLPAPAPVTTPATPVAVPTPTTASPRARLAALRSRRALVHAAVPRARAQVPRLRVFPRPERLRRLRNQ